MPAHLPAALLPTMDLLSETVSLQGTLSSLSLHWSRHLSTTIDKYLEQNLVSVWWYFQWTSTSDWVTKAGFSQTGFLTKRALRGSWPSRCFRTEQGVTSLQVSEWTPTDTKSALILRAPASSPGKTKFLLFISQRVHGTSVQQPN